MADQLCHVPTFKSVTGLDETVAAVGAFVYALAGSRDHHGRIIRHHRDGMSIELDACFDIFPALATVLAAHDPPFFNGTKDDQWIIRAEGKTFDVAHVGRSREGPIEGFGQVSELLAVDPTLATVRALENRRRTGADKQLGAFRMLHHAPSFFIKDPVVDLAPALPAVFAPLHAAAAGRGVDAARIVSVNLHRRSQRPFALKRQRTRPVLHRVGLYHVKTVFGADIENSI